jgi:hypothetical protein
MSASDLKKLFTYHQPTPITAPKYSALRAAEIACAALCTEILERPLSFDEISESTLAFAQAIDDEAPGSADKTAAIRCVRLARAALNEAQATRSAIDSTELVRLANEARAELRRARWQACAAVALDQPKAAPIQEDRKSPTENAAPAEGDAPPADAVTT